jgi:hypothetical protein
MPGPKYNDLESKINASPTFFICRNYKILLVRTIGVLLNYLEIYCALWGNLITTTNTTLPLYRHQ